MDCQGERKWWTVRERGSGGLSGREEVVGCQGERKWWTVRERGSGGLTGSCGLSGREEVVDIKTESQKAWHNKDPSIFEGFRRRAYRAYTYNGDVLL